MNKVKYSDFKKRIVLQRVLHKALKENWQDIATCWAYVAEYNQRKKLFGGELKDMQYSYYILIRDNLSIEQATRIKYAEKILYVEAILAHEKNNFLIILANESQDAA